MSPGIRTQAATQSSLSQECRWCCSVGLWVQFGFPSANRECHRSSRETYSWVMTSCPSQVPWEISRHGLTCSYASSPLSGGGWFIAPTPCPPPPIVRPSYPDSSPAPDLTPVYIAKLQVQFNTKIHVLPTPSLWPFPPSIFSGIWDPLGHETNTLFIMMEARPCLYLVFPRGESISVHTCFLLPGFVLDECPLFCLLVCLVLFLFKVK